MLINNRYQIVRDLGEGGFGKAYLATDTQMPSKRQCVIKQLKPISTSREVYQLVQVRFEREAAILEQLGENHPQIPRLYAYFSENNNFYLVQEWIAGETLESLAARQLPQSEKSVRSWLVALLPALDFVHQQGIIHRDIKPSNIILRAGTQQPVLIDFGAVKETMTPVVNRENAASSIVVGTPGYMAAEQAAGRPTASSDLYSLALTAVYLLTGDLPQALPTDAQSGEIVLSPAAIASSTDLTAVLAKAIRYHPKDRYNSAGDMLIALTKNSSSPSATLQPTVINTTPTTTGSPTPQPVAASQIETIAAAPTLPNSQAESDSTLAGQEIGAIANPLQRRIAKPWYQSKALLATGLVLLVASIGIPFGRDWVVGRQANQTEQANPSNQATTNQSADKCFNLITYDSEDKSINVRDAPDGNVIYTLPNLSVVQTEGPAAIDPGWNEIYINQTEARGYIWGELLHRTSYQVNDPEDTSANLRKTPDGELITVVANGTEVAFLGIDGDWTHVQLSSGQTGFMSTSRLIPPSCF